MSWIRLYCYTEVVVRAPDWERREREREREKREVERRGVRRRRVLWDYWLFGDSEEDRGLFYRILSSFFRTNPRLMRLCPNDGTGRNSVVRYVVQGVLSN